MRDEFSAVVKATLAKRVGYRCSNPACRQQTSGPTSDTDGVINVGVAAHITAAAAGGPRYDATLLAKARRSADNGIWLCQTCAKLIDSDCVRYSSEILRTWRKLAEQIALAELESRSGAARSLRPWVIIDGYFPEMVQDEDTGEEYVSENLHIVNRGQIPAVNITIPDIRLAGFAASFDSQVPTLGPGESAHVKTWHLDELLRGVSASLWKLSQGSERKSGIIRFLPVHLALKAEYGDLDYNRWITEHRLSFIAPRISFTIARPNDPQQWTDLTVLEQQPAAGGGSKGSGKIAV